MTGAVGRATGSADIRPFLQAQAQSKDLDLDLHSSAPPSSSAMSSESEPGLHLRLSMLANASSSSPVTGSDGAAAGAALVDSSPSSPPDAEGWESVQADGAAASAAPQPQQQPMQKKPQQPSGAQVSSDQLESEGGAASTLAVAPPCHSCGQPFSSHFPPCMLPCGHALCPACAFREIIQTAESVTHTRRCERTG